MKKAKVLIYDGSFNGFLTAVFMAFEERLAIADIRKNNQVQNGLFSEVQTVFTQMNKAKRVWNGIENKSHSAIKEVYFSFLSESKGIEMVLFKYIQKLFISENVLSSEPNPELALKTSQLSKMVGREKHRVESSINFELTKDNVYFANISPDFNVLPLISKYFRSKYSDRQWIIYDTKRKFGLYYDGFGVEIVSLDLRELYANSVLTSNMFSGEECEFEQLRNDYFRNTNIKLLINRKLHKQPFPKRYRKYSAEKEAV